MECFAKIVESYKYFSMAFYLRSLTGFWILPSLNKYSLNVERTRTIYFMRHIQNTDVFRTLSTIVNSDIFRHIHVLFRHIQQYCGIFRILFDSCTFRTLPYPKYWHIYNLRCIQNSVKVYSGMLRTLCNARLLRNVPYSELCHIQNFAIFRTWGILRTLSNI